MRITLVSESAFTVRGHGVHTAFVEMAAGLRAAGEHVSLNRFGPADITHIHTIGPYALMHLLFGRGRKVVSVHVIPDSFVGSLAGAAVWLPVATAYMRWFYGRADHLVAVSDEVAGALKGKLKLAGRPVTVLPNTVTAATYRRVDGDRDLSRRRLGLENGRQVVIGVGQVQPRKRVDTFIRLAHDHPEATFIWVGGIPFKGLGASRAAMERMLALAPANFKSTGVIELEQVRDYYLAADVMVLPSDQENHPLAVLEAAASGLPVIVRDIPEYDSTFGQDVVRATELTFERELECLTSDQSAYAAAVAGSARIADRYDTAAGIGRLRTLYRQLTGIQ